MDLIFILLFLIGSLFIVVGLRIVKINPFQLSITSFLIASIIIFAYIGLFFLYFRLDPWTKFRIVDKTLILRVFISSFWSIWVIIVVKALFDSVRDRNRKVSSLRIEPTGFDNAEKLLIKVLFLINILVLIMYLVRIPEVALFVVFTRGSAAAEVARSAMGNNFQGKYHWFSLFLHDFGNIVAYAAFANWLVKKRKRDLLGFCVSFIYVSFTSLMATEKSPFVWLLIGIIMIYYLQSRAGHIDIKSFIWIGIPLIAILLITFIMFSDFKNLSSALLGVVSRIFISSIEPAYYYFQFFPAFHSFIGGRSFPNPGGILGFETYNLPVEIANFVSPELKTRGVMGSMPTVFWAEMYANFGLLGIVFSPIFVGVLVYLIDSYFTRRAHTPLDRALQVWLILHYKNLAITGLSGFIIDFQLVMVLGFILVGRIVSRGLIGAISTQNLLKNKGGF